jgi:uncharacterized membrane protein YfcA
MIAVVLALSVVVGLSLGLLGGGGSILTVPILVYAAGLPAKEAIATSLLVVAVTAAAAVIAHARARRVRWRVGLVFGAAGMAGAYAGGQLARFVPAGVLLAGFAVMMLATAVAMLRPRKIDAAPPRQPRLVRFVLDGLVVGVITGMVGAGGGFLVTPALVLLGGLPMEIAVGTSLLVIAMKSFAGFAGYLGHVEIDVGLAALVSAAAVAGTLAGSRLARRIAPDTLRRGFAWLTIVMAVVLVGGQLPAELRAESWFRALFVERWPWWIGGAAISGVVLLLLLRDNKLLGVSTGYAEICNLRRDPTARRSWRLPFLGGIVLGGLVAAALAGRTPGLALGGFDAMISSSLAVKLPVLLGAGVLIGWGARAAGGCTSGHGIVGTALLARSSLVATVTFLAGGFAATALLTALLGAAS